MPDPKEQIIPVRPTVFVGLGGTGKEILLRLRMKFYELYGDFGYPCMSYVWIDTDMQNLNVDKKEMDIVLQRALFNQSETADIQVPNPNDFLNNPSKFSWITKWMPPAVLQSGLRIQEGAGQVRSKGRFGFYWKYREVRKKLEQAISQVRGPQAKVETVEFNKKNKLNLLLDDKGWGTMVNFFIASSLAGGTGSGTFIDTAFLLRDIAYGSAGQNFKPDITALLFLSSLFTSETRDRRYANTYAALKELEYYNYTPEAGARDIEERDSQRKVEAYALRKFEEKWAENEPQRPVNGPPFNTCYLIDGYTFGGTPVTSDHKHEVFDMASEYLFWEFYRGDFAAHKRTLRPNNRQFLDRNHPEPHGPEKNPFHMQRFSTGYSSFGLSWIRVPVGRRISACGYRLSQEILEFWERGGLMSKAAAQELLRKRNVVEQVRKAFTGDPLHLSGESAIVDIATMPDGTKFSEVLKNGILKFSELPAGEQSPSEFAATFEDQYLARRVGAIIHDHIGPNKNRVLAGYKERILKWILSALESEGFIPILGFTFQNPDSSQARVNGYLDIVTEVIFAELQNEVDSAKITFEDKKAAGEERKETYFNNFEELAGNFVLFKKMSHKVLTGKCLEAEQLYAEGVVGEWASDIASEVLEDLRTYIKDIKGRLKLFYDGTLSPTIGEFADMRRRNEVEDKRAMTINLYRNLDEYYRLGGNPVDVREEKELLFRSKLSDLWKVTTQMSPDEFKRPVEEYGLKKFRDDFQRTFAAGSEAEPLANAVQLFNETYPPTDQTQRRNQISIFLEGGKPYVQPRMALGPRAPQPHEDIIIGMNGITPEAPPGSDFFKELRTQHGLSNAEGIQAESEAVLYYHELTGLPLFYLSSLEQYRQSYDFFQGRLGELPVHFHRRVDMFPEIFLYNPDEARGMFAAWETIILGTLLRVLQVENVGDDFRYFYYLGMAADPKVIGDEKGSVRSLFAEPGRYSWCSQEIERRKTELYQDVNKLKVYYGLLQILSKEVFTVDDVYLADGQNVSLASFQASVVQKAIREAETSVTVGTIPQNNPEEPSPEWTQLLGDARLGSDRVKSDKGGKEEFRYYIKTINPFTVKQN